MTEGSANGDNSNDRGSCGARAVLVCDHAERGDRTPTCADLLAPDRADAVDLLHVSFSDVPAVDYGAVRERGVEIDRSALVLVGAEPDEAAADRTVEVESVETVEQLGDLGMHVREVLTEWSANGNPSVVCFDSVNDLFERADFELTFEFLLVLVEGIRRWDVIAHFHFERSEGDGQTRHTLAHLFDDVIGLDDPPT